MQRAAMRSAIAVSILALLASCGGGGGNTPGSSTAGGASTSASDIPTQPQAVRLLAQASFGATSSEIDHLTASGASAWIDEQFGKPQTLHRSYMDSIAAAGTSLSQNNFLESFWQQAVTGEDQLRQRVAFALSQIFVVSFQDSNVANFPRGVASYYDMLAADAFGNYRQLLEDVSLHPMMGIYLTSLRNQKESGSRVPDENYAREVTQLLSIGPYELNQDGSLKLIDN